MAGVTPVSGLRYVTLGDAANANTLSQNLATDLDHLVIPKYATTTARGTANPTPTEGDYSYLSIAGATKGYYGYSGSAWVGPSMLNQPWTSYTPTWNTSTGLHTPTIGNGSFAFKYWRIGPVCFVQFQMTAGSTTNFNSGGAGDNWQWSLPFAATATITAGMASFNSASTTVPLQILITSGASLFTLNMAGAEVSNAGVAGNTSNGGSVDAVTPFTWTSSSANFVGGQFFYLV